MLGVCKTINFGYLNKQAYLLFYFILMATKPILYAKFIKPSARLFALCLVHI